MSIASMSVTVSQVGGSSARPLATPAKSLSPVASNQTAVPTYNALHGAVDCAVCLGLTLLTPLMLCTIFVLGVAKTCSNTYNTGIKGSWNH